MDFKLHNSNEVNKLFNRKVNFTNDGTFTLPEKAYTSAKWSHRELQDKKTILNEVKSQLSCYYIDEWAQHTRKFNPSGLIVKHTRDRCNPEVMTQAWCKFYECLHTYPLIPEGANICGQLTSLHLCEAPGAFVSALNHYLANTYPYLRWKWNATTLNPDYEGNCPSKMVNDTQLIRYTYENWDFGLDFTGDITKYYNHVDLIKTKLNTEKVWLITADGSINCMSDPGNQERLVEYLQYCETLTALAVLKENGSFVLKIFTMFEDSTICLLYLLTSVFDNVTHFKPAASKSGNSEIYVVCTGFKGFGLLENIWESLIQPYKIGHFDDSYSMFDEASISKTFFNQLILSATFFMEKQIKTIEQNISLYNDRRDYDADLDIFKMEVAKTYIKKYKVRKIPRNRRLVHFDDSQTFWPYAKEIKFVNGIVELRFLDILSSYAQKPVDYLINQILDVRKGFQFKSVKSSRFGSIKRLNNLRSCITNCSSLFNYARIRIAENVTVIVNANFTNYHEFQKYIFYSVYNSNKRKILFVQVPLITNFLVGLVYIMMLCFEKMFLNINGCLYLHDCSGAGVRKMKRILEVIDTTYKSLSNDQGFPSDICQIVPPGLLYKNDFADFMVKYNDIVEKAILKPQQIINH